jgi:hypothetical protein
MPEHLEKQLNPQDLAELFSFLALDNPPSDPPPLCRTRRRYGWIGRWRV